MAGPRIDELYKYMTLPRAAKRLGMHQAKLRRRLKAGIVPPPTFVNKYGLRFFNEDWIRQAQAILDSSFERENMGQGEDTITNNKQQMNPESILTPPDPIKEVGKE